MFGDTEYFDEKILSMDTKGRLIIPSGTNREKNDEVAILYDDTLNAYKIINYNVIKKLIEKLRKKISCSKNEQESKIYTSAYYKLAYKILGIRKVDNQGRIMIANVFKDEMEFDKDVLVKGAGDHILVKPIQKKLTK